MPQTPEQAEATMVANLKEKTGKTLEQWLKLTAGKFAKHGEIVNHLKTEHGVTHGYANLIAQRALQAANGPPPDGDGLVDAQYVGAKAALRPWYETLIAAIKKFGGDVEVSPKKAYVSLRRNKQFALIQPSTATRLDVGLCLKGTPPTERLEASGSFNAMCSHRVRVGDPKEINAQLIGWLKQAYAAS